MGLLREYIKREISCDDALLNAGNEWRSVANDKAVTRRVAIMYDRERKEQHKM